MAVKKTNIAWPAWAWVLQLHHKAWHAWYLKEWKKMEKNKYSIYIYTYTKYTIYKFQIFMNIQYLGQISTNLQAALKNERVHRKRQSHAQALWIRGF